MGANSCNGKIIKNRTFWATMKKVVAKTPLHYLFFSGSIFCFSWGRWATPGRLATPGGWAIPGGGPTGGGRSQKH